VGKTCSGQFSLETLNQTGSFKGGFRLITDCQRPLGYPREDGGPGWWGGGGGGGGGEKEKPN